MDLQLQPRPPPPNYCTTTVTSCRCACLPVCMAQTAPAQLPHTSENKNCPCLQELKDLIKRFLVRATTRRIGCMSGGVAEVKQHPWFK